LLKTQKILDHLLFVCRVSICQQNHDPSCLWVSASWSFEVFIDGFQNGVSSPGRAFLILLFDKWWNICLWIYVFKDIFCCKRSTRFTIARVHDRTSKM